MSESFRISLKAARINADMTQEEVAKSIGISKVTLIKWENGDTVPTADKAEKLSELYKCPLGRIDFCRKS